MELALLLTLKRMRMTMVMMTVMVVSASPRAGSSEECRKPGFSFHQPARLSGSEGGSVNIPFSFDYPWKEETNPEVDIAWRWKDFFGEPIYNKTQNYIHKAFQNRLFLNWTKEWKNGSLQIRDLRREDVNTYFCRVQVKTLRCGPRVWGSIVGTKLIIPAMKTSTTSISTTTDNTTEVNTSASHRDPQGSGSVPLSVETVVGLAMLSSVLKAAILGLAVYPRWKRSQG